MRFRLFKSRAIDEVENPLHHLLSQVSKEDVEFASKPPHNKRKGTQTYGNFTCLGTYYDGFPRQQFIIVEVENGQNPYASGDIKHLENVSQKFGLRTKPHKDHYSLHRKVFGINRKVAMAYDGVIYISASYKRAPDLLQALGRELYHLPNLPDLQRLERTFDETVH